MRLIPIFESLILLEYSEKIINQLIQKFQLENPKLKENTIRLYISDFEKISQKLQNRDILTYTWKDLEQTVDSNRTTKIKAGKIDVTAEDANLLYNKNGLRLYHGNSKNACIKYGNGYSFCISARGNRNLYGQYRRSNPEWYGTPYFLFNDNLSKKDKRHVLVIFHYKDPHFEFDTTEYTVTTAANDGEQVYEELDMIEYDYPWVEEVKKYIKGQKLSPYEKGVDKVERKYVDLQDSLKSQIKKLRDELAKHHVFEFSAINDSVLRTVRYWDNFVDLVMKSKSNMIYKLDFDWSLGMDNAIIKNIQFRKKECRFKAYNFVEYFEEHPYTCNLSNEFRGPFIREIDGLYRDKVYDFGMEVYNDLVRHINKEGGYLKQFLPFNKDEEYVITNVTTNPNLAFSNYVSSEQVRDLYLIFKKFPEMRTLFKKYSRSYTNERDSYDKLKNTYRDIAY